MNLEVIRDRKLGLVVSSRVIANELGKRHSDVKESIENIVKNQSAEISADIKKVIFSNIYKDSKNRNYKEYLLTKDGFILYMFNIQGHIDFKVAYINEFNRMEKELNDNESKGSSVLVPADKIKYWNMLRTAEEKLMENIIDLTKEYDKLSEVLKGLENIKVLMIGIKALESIAMKKLEGKYK